MSSQRSTMKTRSFKRSVYREKTKKRTSRTSSCVINPPSNLYADTCVDPFSDVAMDDPKIIIFLCSETCHSHVGIQRNCNTNLNLWVIVRYQCSDQLKSMSVQFWMRRLDDQYRLRQIFCFPLKGKQSNKSVDITWSWLSVNLSIFGTIDCRSRNRSSWILKFGHISWTFENIKSSITVQ